MLILGIDPGSNITGYGLIEYKQGKYRYLDSGHIKLNGITKLELKLQQIYQDLQQLIQVYQPSDLAIERVFVCHNPAGALKLGQARAAAILAAVNSNLVCYEYAAREVKQAVVGYGNASKHQMQEMVRVLLNLSGIPQQDAADALSIALCHAHSMRSKFL